MAGHMILRVVALSLLAAAGAAGGQANSPESLADPTRPPPGLLGTPGSNPVAITAGPVLQSVLEAPDRKAAIISGERVELGGRYGQAKLVRLTDSEALLEGPEGRTLLRLVPGVEKRPAGASTSAVKQERKSSKNNAPIPKGAGR
jgi:MSHA biogenesis protein MshK